MDYRQQSRLDALYRVRSFLNENVLALGEINSSSSRATLDKMLPEIEESAAAQNAAVVHATSATLLKNQLREELRRHHMRPIAVIARSSLAHTPYIGKLRLPKKNSNDSTVVTAGRAMAYTAEQYKGVFLAESLPEDFLIQLSSAVDAVRETAVTRDRFQRQLIEATQAVDTALSIASEAVQILDALIEKQLRGQGELLVGWKLAKHPKAKPGVPKGTAASAPPSTAPSETTATIAAAPLQLVQEVQAA